MKKIISLLLITFVIIALNAAVDLGDQHAPMGLPSDCISYKKDIKHKDDEIALLKQKLSFARKLSTGVSNKDVQTIEKEIQQLQKEEEGLRDNFDRTCTFPTK